MTFYSLLNILGLVQLLSYNIMLAYSVQDLPKGRLRTWAAKRNNPETKEPAQNDHVWLAVEVFLISCVQYAPAALLNKNIGVLLGTGANYFVTLYTAPIFLYFGCKALQSML